GALHQLTSVGGTLLGEEVVDEAAEPRLGALSARLPGRRVEVKDERNKIWFGEDVAQVGQGMEWPQLRGWGGAALRRAPRTCGAQQSVAMRLPELRAFSAKFAYCRPIGLDAVRNVHRPPRVIPRLGAHCSRLSFKKGPEHLRAHRSRWLWAALCPFAGA